MSFFKVISIQTHVCDLSTGVLACLDGYMNIAIEQTEEYVNGQLKNKYGDAFLRGNNGKIIKFIIIFSILWASLALGAEHSSCQVKSN